MITKKKTSIDFSVDGYNKVQSFAKRNKKSIATVINQLVMAFVDLPEPLKDDLAGYCHRKLNDLARSSGDEGAFHRKEDENMEQYLNSILEVLGEKHISEVKAADRTRLRLKDGYVDYPNDWILIDTAIPPEEASHCFVLECRNSIKYGIPHFIGSSNRRYGNDYTDDDMDTIYKACEAAWPEFSEIIEKQVPPPHRSRYENEEDYDAAVRKHLDSPFIGIFSITRDDDELYSKDGEEPYNCIIHTTI